MEKGRTVHAVMYSFHVLSPSTAPYNVFIHGLTVLSVIVSGTVADISCNSSGAYWTNGNLQTGRALFTVAENAGCAVRTAGQLTACYFRCAQHTLLKVIDTGLHAVFWE
jgi:hypothetical protein